MAAQWNVVEKETQKRMVAYSSDMVQRQHESGARKQNRWLAVLLVGLCVSSVCIFGWWLNWEEQQFEKKKWLDGAGNRDRDNPRGSMVRHLQSEVLRKGLSESDVQALLGDPDYVATKDSGVGVWSYTLGLVGFMPVDEYTFDIHFDLAGKVVESRVSQH